MMKSKVSSKDYIDNTNGAVRALVVHPRISWRNKFNVRDSSSRLLEAVGLSKAIDLDVVDSYVLPVSSIHPKTFFGSGRLGDIGNHIEHENIDLVVFGKSASITAAKKIKPNSKKIDIKNSITEKILDRFDTIRYNKGDSRTANIRAIMQNIMQQKCGVFRTKDLMTKGINDFAEIEKSMKNINVKDKSLIFNTDLVESLELHNLMAQSKVTLYSALNRKETRGAHARRFCRKR